MLHGKIGPSDVNTSIIPTLIKNYVDANKFNGRKSELLNVASHSISSLVWRVSYLNNLSRTRKEFHERISWANITENIKIGMLCFYHLLMIGTDSSSKRDLGVTGWCMFYTKWGQRSSLDKIEGLGKTTLRILPTYNAQSNNKLLVTSAICIITTKGIEITYVRMGALTRLLQG